MATGKITRKQLLKEPDEFITFSARMINLATEYRLQIAVAVCVFIGVILLTVGIRFFSERAEARAFAKLDQHVAAYERIRQSDGAQKAYEDVSDDFHQLIDNYSGKVGGKLARLIFANISFDGGNAEQAIALYTASLKDFDDHPSLRHVALSGLAYSHRAKNDLTASARFFETIAESPDSIMKDEALFNLGSIYAEMGDAGKSLNAFEKIVSDYDDSPYYEIAKEKIAG